MLTITKKMNTGIVLLQEPIPNHVFEQFSFWTLLNAHEQEELEEETAKLLNAHHQLGLSSIEIGQRLMNIRTLLAPYKGAFTQILQAAHFTGRTGYRYIKNYQRLLEYINQPVLDAMIAHGFKLRGATDDRPLGEYTEAYLALTENNELPPEHPDEATITSYVTKLEVQYERLKADPAALSLVKTRVEKTGNEAIHQIRNSFDFLQKQNHHLLKSSLRRIPSNRRDEFIERHVGYALTLRGVTSKRFEAQAIPSRFSRAPGRPVQERYEG
jgi:hypothetical protein